MKKNRWKRIAVRLSAATIFGIAGCGVGVDVPEKAPTTAEIKDWSDRRITVVEQAIRKKDWKLPSRVTGLVRYLRGLRINVTIGPGQTFKNTGEAIQALDRVILKLENWYNQSRNRREGDSDEDRARLQVILDETKGVLKNIKVGRPKAR